MYQISLILSVMNWVRVCLAYPTLPYPTLPYPTLPYPTLPCPTLPYPTLPYPLPYPTLPYVQNAAKQERRIWGAVSTLPHFLVQLRLP